MTESKTAPDYTLICPSRGRPKMAYECAYSAYACADDPERLEFTVYLDGDDETRPEYETLFSGLRREFETALPKIMSGPSVGVPRAANALAFSASAPVIVTATDDQRFKSNGWDTLLDRELAGFPDSIYCMWFNDNWESQHWCTAPIVSKQWVRTLGYFCHPLFEHYYCDTWIWLLARKLGRARYIPDVTVEHWHYKAKTRELDATDRLRGEDGGAAKQKRDRQALQLFQRYLQMDAALLQRAIDAHGVDRQARDEAAQRSDTITMG